MNTFHDYLISTAHVSAEHAPYYLGWVRQTYEITGEKLTVPLSRDAEKNVAGTSGPLTGRIRL